MENVKDSKGKNYLKTESGTCYDPETDSKVIEILENLLNGHRETRIRLWYGKNGKSWDEENDVCGYIGRSTGTIKIPLLIEKANSFGGGGLLDSCIVKIVDTKTKRVLYQHPNFPQSVFTVSIPSDLKEYSANVLRDGELYARCKTEKQAHNLAGFMNGERMSK